MQFDFGLVTKTEIRGSDLFGDIQSVLKSLTILLNGFRHTGDACRHRKQSFRGNVRNSGHMSRISGHTSGHQKTRDFVS